MKGFSSQYLQSTPLPSIDHWESDIMTMYNGSDRKEGLIAPDGIRYLIKYPEEHTRMNDMDTSYVNNILSEYISSHVLNIAGFPAHETFIGVRNQEPVVACKNFVDEKDTLSEFGHYMRKHYNSCEIGPVPDIRQIQYILNDDPVLRPQSEHFWNIYWERFIGDALVGNFDRHMGNWGYVVHRQTRSVTEAPIYDNGSTLYPALSEKAMEQDGRVDDISLLLSLDHNSNERIQMSLDEIREKHELPIK